VWGMFWDQVPAGCFVEYYSQRKVSISYTVIRALDKRGCLASKNVVFGCTASRRPPVLLGMQQPGKGAAGRLGKHTHIHT
jgi:hypothetical protein